MKKMISAFVVTVCLVLAMPAQGQVHFGLKGGLNLSKASFSGLKENFKKDNFTGFFIGPMVQLNVPVVGLDIDGALLFSQRGIKANDTNIKQNGLDIPLNLKYNIGLGEMIGIYFAAGPDFYFDFEKNKDVWKDNSLQVDKKNVEVGFNLGAGVKLINHLQVGFNYNMPFGDTAKFFKGEEEVGSYKTKTWQVSAAYIF